MSLIELKKDSQTKQNKGAVEYRDYSLYYGKLAGDEPKDGAAAHDKGGPR